MIAPVRLRSDSAQSSAFVGGPTAASFHWCSKDALVPKEQPQQQQQQRRITAPLTNDYHR